MATTILQKGEIVTLLTSYCSDNKGCTDRHPCNDCMLMCNTFELTEEVIAIYKGEVKKDL